MCLSTCVVLNATFLVCIKTSDWIYYTSTNFNLHCLVGGRTFFIANTSKLLKTAQLYQFQAETSQDKERLVVKSS